MPVLLPPGLITLDKSYRFLNLTNSSPSWNSGTCCVSLAYGTSPLTFTCHFLVLKMTAKLSLFSEASHDLPVKWSLYSFPKAAVTEYQKLDSSKI